MEYNEFDAENISDKILGIDNLQSPVSIHKRPRYYQRTGELIVNPCPEGNAHLRLSKEIANNLKKHNK